MSRIGAKISGIRMQKGMTQKQLAKAIGVNEKFVIDMETGKRVISDDLVKRISKALEHDITEIIIYEASVEPEVKVDVKPQRRLVEPEVQKVWNDAFDSILKTISVYDYSLTKAIDTRQMPVVANKVEGYAKDKVVYIQILDNDMLGFRMGKGDLAFGYMTHEIENNSICLVEYNGIRAIRQIKKLEGDRILLVSNSGTLGTEAVSARDIKVLVRLTKLEIKL